MSGGGVARTRSKKYARVSIVTIDGTGDQQALNLVAFQQALAQHGDDQRRKMANVLESENKSLQDRLQREQDRNEDLAGLASTGIAHPVAT